MSLRTLEIFCGAGGSSRGAAMAGAEPVAAIDMWAVATETYKLNFPDAITYTMNASSLAPDRVQNDVGSIDLLLASPECTSHSVAKGSRPGCEKSRGTAFEVIRFAKVLKPRWIVVENVQQMRSWKRFDRWYAKLRALGYKTRIGTLNSQDHGTPQSRKRLFVVCDSESEPALPEPRTGTVKTVASILGRGELRSRPWRFSKLSVAERAKATIDRAKRAIKELGATASFIMVYYGTDGAGGFQTIDRPLRTVTTLDRFAYVRPNGRGHEMRMLQPPELAAAMGFPRRHAWPEASRRDLIRLIGNAVCPPVMRDVVKTLVDS